jgi:hypothetical protein
MLHFGNLVGVFLGAVSAIPLGILLLLNLLLLPSGLVFLKRGLRPAPVGIEPHCRRCGYLLIGIDSAACPECGIATSPANVVYGQRKRQLGVAALGAAIWFFPCFVLIGFAMHGVWSIPWYHFKPTFMVIRDLQSGGSASLEAMHELDRRENTGALSTKYEQQLVDMGLAQQATTARTTFANWTIEFTEEQFQTGKLTDAQKQRFFQQCVQLQLSVPPMVVTSQFVPFQVNAASRVTVPHFYVTIAEWKSVSIDDRVLISASLGDSGFSGLGASTSPGSSVPCKTPGHHVLTVVAEIRVYQGMGATGPVLYTEDRALTAPFEVVPPGATSRSASRRG